MQGQTAEGHVFGLCHHGEVGGHWGGGLVAQLDDIQVSYICNGLRNIHELGPHESRGQGIYLP